MKVAEKILEQLGGQKFIAMTRPGAGRGRRGSGNQKDARGNIRFTSGNVGAVDGIAQRTLTRHGYEMSAVLAAMNAAETTGSADLDGWTM